jgi:hypothetical protein
MVTTTILYFFPENQSPKRSHSACGPLSSAWRSRRAPVAYAPLLRSLPCTVDSAMPRSCSDDRGGQREGVCAATHASGRDHGLSAMPHSSKVYRSRGGLGSGQAPYSTGLTIEPAASLRTRLRKVLALEGFETCLKPCIAMQNSRLLTWRSRKASRWISGIALSGDMGPA